MVYPVGAQEAAAPVAQEGHLVGQGDLGGVPAVVAPPVHGPRRGLGGQLDAAAGTPGGGGGGPDGQGGQPGGGVGAGGHGGGEPDAAVVHHPQAHADLEVVRRRLEVAVAQRHPLGADGLHPELGLRAAELLGGAEGRRLHGAYGVDVEGLGHRG